MGFTTTITLFLVLFLIVVSSSTTTTTSLPSSSPSSSSHEVKLGPRGGADVAVRYRVFYIKNTTPFYVDSQSKPLTKNSMRKKKKTTMMMKRKKIKKLKTNSRTPFSVMLPKGFVPPSGSSPCHNENPNSVVFFCELATSPPKP